jgi:hypothetical protein
MKLPKQRDLVRKVKTAVDLDTKGVEAVFSCPSLMHSKRASNPLLKDLTKKLSKSFLNCELQAERLANESQGSLLLTPITLHLDIQAMQSLYATAREKDKAIATVLHKRLSDSLKYHLKRNVIFHLAFGIAYDKDRALAKGERVPLYHVHMTALLTPREADSHTRQGKKAHRAFKCLNKLPKTKEFVKQECHFSTPSEQGVYTHEYAHYKEFGSRQRWSDYKLKNAREALFRDKNNFFNSLSDLEAGSRELKAQSRNNKPDKPLTIKPNPPKATQTPTKPEKTNLPPITFKLPPHIEKLRADLQNDPSIGELKLSDAHKEVLEGWRDKPSKNGRGYS